MVTENGFVEFVWVVTAVKFVVVTENGFVEFEVAIEIGFVESLSIFVEFIELVENSIVEFDVVVEIDSIDSVLKFEEFVRIIIGIVETVFVVELFTIFVEFILVEFVAITKVGFVVKLLTAFRVKFTSSIVTLTCNGGLVEYIILVSLNSFVLSFLCVVISLSVVFKMVKVVFLFLRIS